MATLNCDLPLLDQNPRFPVRKTKMRDVLIQMGLHWCLEGHDNMPEPLSAEMKDFYDLRSLC